MSEPPSSQPALSSAEMSDIWTLIEGISSEEESGLDKLVTDESTSLLDVLDHPNLLQELKSNNVNVITFFTPIERLAELLQFFLFPSSTGPSQTIKPDEEVDGEEEEDDPELIVEKYLYRLPFVASQVLQCDIEAINRLVSTTESLIKILLSFVLEFSQKKKEKKEKEGEEEGEGEGEKEEEVENHALITYFLRVVQVLLRNDENYVGIVEYILEKAQSEEEGQGDAFLNDLIVNRFNLFRFECFVMSVLACHVKEDEWGNLVPFEEAGFGMSFGGAGLSRTRGILRRGITFGGFGEEDEEEGSEREKAKLALYEKTKKAAEKLFVEKGIFERLVERTLEISEDESMTLADKVEYGRNVFLVLKCLIMSEKKIPELSAYMWQTLIPLIRSKIDIEDTSVVMKYFITRSVALVGFVVEHIQKTGQDLLFMPGLDVPEGEVEDEETKELRLQKEAIVARLVAVGSIIKESFLPLLSSKNLSTRCRESILATIVQYGSLAWKVEGAGTGVEDSLISGDLVKDILTYFSEMPNQTVIHVQVISLLASMVEAMEPNATLQVFEEAGILDVVVSLGTKKEGQDPLPLPLRILGAQDYKYRLARVILDLQGKLKMEHGADADTNYLWSHSDFVSYVESELKTAKETRDRHLGGQDAQSKTTFYNEDPGDEMVELRDDEESSSSSSDDDDMVVKPDDLDDMSSSSSDDDMVIKDEDPKDDSSSSEDDDLVMKPDDDEFGGPDGPGVDSSSSEDDDLIIKPDDLDGDGPGVASSSSSDDDLVLKTDDVDPADDDSSEDDDLVITGE